MRRSVEIGLCFFCTIAILTACQKKSVTESASSTASNSSQAPSAPTGLVKNAIRHTEETADVTRWMEMASTKTPAQLAEEAKQKQLKDTLSERELKSAPEAKSPDIKSVPLHDQPKSLPAVAVQLSAATAASNVQKMPQPAALPPAPVLPPATTLPTTSVQPVLDLVVPKLISGTPPAFPAAAVLAGVTEGSVSARLSIGIDGKVTQVEILKARPVKVFDKEVIAAASQW
ncbi:energy transducer TonB [Undibacterium sp. RuTC16W]|uniref:energy transducer TonB n=1 Tax=Undibacterium sp. RuTC16W TaxID=3413048 RepID=UPI003BF00E89